MHPCFVLLNILSPKVRCPLFQGLEDGIAKDVQNDFCRSSAVPKNERPQKRVFGKAESQARAGKVSRQKMVSGKYSRA